MIPQMDFQMDHQYIAYGEEDKGGNDENKLSYFIVSHSDKPKSKKCCLWTVDINSASVSKHASFEGNIS